MTAMQLPSVPARPAIAVIGGSTPFLSDLFGALVVAPDAGPADLRLIGRNATNLQIVARHARMLLGHLGWHITATTSVEAGIDGADVVIHQARYGGLEGRAADEALAQSVGVPGDETLGPAGLRAAVRISADVEKMAATLLAHCPTAIVLNLTNPLSVSTQLLAGAGLRHVLGVCELPELTAAQLDKILDRNGDLRWSYTGLNHRGFIHGLGDGLDELATSGSALPGVVADDLLELRAVPLKYFGLWRGRFEGQPVGQVGRAVFLQGVRANALDELAGNPGTRPAALASRQQPWWAYSVVPVLETLRTGRRSEHVMNLPDGDGLVREVRVVVDNGHVNPIVDEPPAELRDTLLMLEEHERRVLAAVADPAMDTVRAACETDPMLLARRADSVAQLVLASLASTDAG